MEDQIYVNPLGGGFKYFCFFTPTALRGERFHFDYYVFKWVETTNYK